ncbi:hypothetical protein Bca4012_092782 [Brassica carinata]|uniref:Uncharacterized protein n=1 Tax=Brassica carinata TaxID=52824 RepID=A0A8X7TW65_BRACI|nr:hypothetical protein Bca52824_075075 [Brassica carinata]
MVESIHSHGSSENCLLGDSINIVSIDPVYLCGTHFNLLGGELGGVYPSAASRAVFYDREVDVRALLRRFNFPC